MARTSLAAAKAELLALLVTGTTPTVSGVTAVFGHEPFPGQAAKPVSVTVATAGITPTAYLLAVRIYQTTDVDAAAAQSNLDTLIQAVDAKMTAGFGPSNWEVTWEPELSAYVAVNLLEVGREDPAFHQ